MAFSQSRYTISGSVSNEDGERLIGANVYLHETMQGVHTSGEGTFEISNVKPGAYHIHVTFVGYHSYSADLFVESDLKHDVVLEPAINQLHEVLIETDPLKADKFESSTLSESVDRDYLENNGGTSLMQSLERLPGISYINMGVGVSKPVIRGLSFNRVVVADQGIKQEGQQWGSDHGLEIDQYDMDQIEILKGPASLAYGSDALGGVVQIRHRLQFPEGRDEAEASYIYRSNNETHGITTGFQGRHRDISYQFRYTGLFYGDYRVPTDEFNYNGFILPIENNRLKNTAGKENHAAFRFAVHRPWGFSTMSFTHFNQRVGIFSGAVGVPRSYFLGHDGDFRDIDVPFQKTLHTKAISNSNIKVGKNWIELDIGYQYNWRQEYSRPDAHGQPVDPTDTLALDLKLQTISSNLRYQVRHNSRWKSIYGFQWSYKTNKHGGFEFLIPDYQQATAGAFVIEQFKVNEKFNLTAGFRLDYGWINIEETPFAFYYRGEFIDTILRSEANERNFFNYALSVGFAYNPKEHVSLKFNFGKSYRIPNAAELASNGVHHGTFRFERGNPDLKSEEGYQTDLGLLVHHDKVNIQVGGYFNWFQNYIYLSPTGRFPRVEVNGQIYPYPETGQLNEYQQASVIHWGGEAAIQYRPIKPVILELSGEYTWFQNTETTLPLPFTPPGSIKTGIEYEFPIKSNAFKGWFIGMNWSWYAAQNRVDRNEAPTPGYNLLGMSLGGEVGKGSNALKLTFVINNLTNREYLSHLSRYRILNIPEPGINASVKLSWLFSRG